MVGEWKERVSLKPKARTAGWSVPKTFYRELLRVADENGFKPGWAYHTYHDKVGGYPPKEEYGDPLPPSEYTKWFVDGLRLKRSRRKR